MPRELNSHNFEAVYQNLGIDVDTLGCVMLGLEPMDVESILPAEWAYTARNPKRFWIKGLQVKSHVTLLYGLLPVYRDRQQYEDSVNEVLSGWAPSPVEIAYVDRFPSPYEDEPYACIVAHLGTEGLIDAHHRLSFLPHINTFPTYKPHMTLAYVKAERGAEAVELLRDAGIDLETITSTNLNYGKLLLP